MFGRRLLQTEQSIGCILKETVVISNNWTNQLKYLTRTIFVIVWSDRVVIDTLSHVSDKLATTRLPPGCWLAYKEMSRPLIGWWTDATSNWSTTTKGPNFGQSDGKIFPPPNPRARGTAGASSGRQLAPLLRPDSLFLSALHFTWRRKLPMMWRADSLILTLSANEGPESWPRDHVCRQSDIVTGVSRPLKWHDKTS